MESTQLLDILLVEDNPDDSDLALEALSEHRLANRVMLVRDGRAALDFLFAEGPYEGRVSVPVRLVLLDIKLPKLDGLEVLRILRADPRTEDLPVVLLTSSAEESDIMRGYKLHANSYIVKPVDFEQFVKAVGDIGLYWAVLNKPPVNKSEGSRLMAEPAQSHS